MHAMINGIDLAYDDFGRGPTVVLLHDLPFCRKMWQPQVSALVEHGFRVIVPDLRGFGESEAGYRPFSLKSCADDVAGLMHYLGIGRAVMIGMGVGGRLVKDIARRHPRRVAALCLLSPGETLAGMDNDVQRRDLAELVREGHRLTAIDALCRRLFSEQQSLLTQQLAWEVQNWIEAVDPSVLAAAFTLGDDGGTSGPSLPTLLLRGDRTGKAGDLLDNQDGKVITETIPGAGHLVNLEQPERVNRCLIGFLDWLSMMKPRHYRLALAA